MSDIEQNVLPFTFNKDWDKQSHLGKGAKKNKEKKLTSVSFAFTHTYTPVKTNIFPFFPQAYMENFEKCAKTQKLKQKIYCPMLPVVVSFPPSFLNLSLM